MAGYKSLRTGSTEGKDDVAESHSYGIAWRPGSLAFTVDGEVVRHADQAPDYPMQLLIGGFDFLENVVEKDTRVDALRQQQQEHEHPAW